MSNVALRAVSSGIAVMAVLRCCVLEVRSLKTILARGLGVLGGGWDTGCRLLRRKRHLLVGSVGRRLLCNVIIPHQCLW